MINLLDTILFSPNFITDNFHKTYVWLISFKLFSFIGECEVLLVTRTILIVKTDNFKCVNNLRRQLQ